MDETLDEYEDDGTEDTSLSVTPRTGGFALPGGLSISDALSGYNTAQGLATKQAQANLDLLVKAQNDLRAMRVGPSESEKWLALAAALGQPTKTGAFGESLGNAAQALGKHKAAAREAEETRKSMLEKYGLEIGSERYKMLQAAANQAGQVYRSVAAANKAPALRPIGTTTEGGKTVAVLLNPSDNSVVKAPIGEAPLDYKPTKETFGGQPVFLSPKGLVLADGTPVGKVDVKPKAPSATVQRQIFDTEDNLKTRLSSLSLLQTALELNNQALEGPLTNWRVQLKRFMGSDDPAYQATESFDNIVGSTGLKDLKTMFGSNPTEGERAAYKELLALSSKPRAVRDAILRRAIAEQQKSITFETDRLNSLKNPDKGFDASNQRVIRFDQKGNRI